MKPKIIVHCLIKNEENFIWYALNSVLPFVDEIMVWDTGSTDQTVNIIKTIKSPKIKFKQLKPVDSQGHTQTRLKMLSSINKNKFDWLMILDGDEIWPEKQLKKVINSLHHTKANTIVVKTKNIIGDIYHYQPQSAGHYQIGNHKGHISIRFIRLDSSKLSIENPHGGQTYTINGIALQNQSPDKLEFVDAYYYHATHLRRSSKDSETLKRSFKFKRELGIKDSIQNLPTIFFSEKPSIVPDVTQKISPLDYLIALITTPLRYIKRKLLPHRSGYIHV